MLGYSVTELRNFTRCEFALLCLPSVLYIDVFSLKTSRQKIQLVSSLLNAWSDLRECEQSLLTEAVEQLSVNTDLASATLKILHDASDKLKTQSEFANVHVLILVGHKFLSLYSSKNAQDLSAADILLMILLCKVANSKEHEESGVSVGDNNEENDIILPRNTHKDEDGGPLDMNAKLANPTSEDITRLFGKEF